MTEVNNRAESIFLYEVVFLNPKGNLARRFSRTVFRVPKSRMSLETKRILREGGTIVSIKPLSPPCTDNGVMDLNDWWVVITTGEPRCKYYFGPFRDFAEADFHRDGYIEDLESEAAIDIEAEIQQCRPEILTIEDF